MLDPRCQNNLQAPNRARKFFSDVSQNRGTYKGIWRPKEDICRVYGLGPFACIRCSGFF